MTHQTKLHRYEGRSGIVTYDVKRCTHAAECVHGLPAVFDPNAKPWINPDGADAAALAAAVTRCPSGALAIERPDGGIASTPAANTATLTANGPTYLRGDIAVVSFDGVVRTETRMALCRCGASQNKPYCDGSHTATAFLDPGRLPADSVAGLTPAGGKLAVTPLPNGPVKCEGPLTITGSDGRGTTTDKAFLCRCGASVNKPYCDGTHKKIGFAA
jgi:CDGSH-type Zn-finger protein/uncharacterized Fe-S cluster protein YjdI